MVHGDLKPENVIIPRDGRPRVVDFGLAQVLLQTMEFSLEDTPILSSDQVTTTTTLSVLRHNKGVVAGTPPYMAPEQWRGEDLTGAADIWALGIILFELLCGRRPFTGANVVMQAAAITGPDPAPALDVPGAPRALVSLVARCLNKDPAERPSAQEAAEILRMSVDDRRGPREVEENPFRGLRPFAEQHAAFFCGRDDEVDAFLELMREEPVLPVVGPSGAGKTSFVQAGVIPRLREQGHLTVLQLRPGDAPFRNLASRLAPALAAGISFADQLGSQDTQSLEHLTSSTLDREENLEQQLRSQPQLLPLLLEQVAGQRGGKVLLFVDQLEELFTLTEEHDEHRKFVRALSAGADDPAGPVRVIYTMREDFLGRLEAEQARVAPLGRITVIHPPNADVLREVLEHPLRTVGYAFEDLGLLGEMVQAAGRDSASLPLLSFTAGQLWEQRDRKRRLITRAAYEEVGGVAGALAAHADRVLERLDPTGEAAVRSILLQMVTPEGTRRAVSRQDALEGLAQNVEPILDRLIDARLVTVRRVRGEAGSRVVLELVHESLIYTWGTLDRWLDRGKEDLAFLQEAGQAVEVWDRRTHRAVIISSTRRSAEAEPLAGQAHLHAEVAGYAGGTFVLACGQGTFPVASAVGARRSRRRLSALVLRQATVGHQRGLGAEDAL